MIGRPPRSRLLPTAVLFRSNDRKSTRLNSSHTLISYAVSLEDGIRDESRSEEHTSELQSHSHLVCRLLLEAPTRRRSAPHSPSINSRTGRRRSCFFNDTASTEISALPPRDALPIYERR